MLERSKDRRIWFVLLAIVLVGSGFRLWGLDTQSFWLDELCSWLDCHQKSLSSLIKFVSLSEGNPPGYFILLHYVQYLGDSEFVLRLPSAVCGILSIGVIFLIGRRLFSWREGLIASTLMAVLECPVHYSQEARPYAMLLLFSMLSVYFLIDIVEHLRMQDEIPLLVFGAYLFVAVVCSYLHYYGIYFIALQQGIAFLLVYRSKNGLIFFVLTLIVVLFCYLPWISYFWGHLHSHPMTDWIRAPEGLFVSLKSFFAFLFIDSERLVLIVVVAYVYVLVRCINVFFRSHSRKDLLLLGWLIIPFAGAYLVSVLTPLHILINRYLIISLPAAYLLLARAFVHIPIDSFRKTIVLFIFVAVSCYHLVFGLKYYSAPRNDQFREAANFVIQNDTSFRGSILIGSAWYTEHLNYYFQSKGFDKLIKYNLVIERQKELAIQEVNKGQVKYLWYVYMHIDPDLSFLDFVKTTMHEVKHKSYFGGAVYLFQKKDPDDKS
ncbi:MAG: glycosyltransferase family 39 protein [Candidatus Omnitrophica bacterium]|nr:glycosyltransferase family 39 protein [Candidatus Omnitrophota bacterium]